MAYQLTLGSLVHFQCESAQEFAEHLRETFPPDGAFPSPNLLNGGFAIVCPDGKRLQSLQAARWLSQNSQERMMKQTIEQAQAALACAEAAYLEELRLDSERSEGSGAQERRREERQQRLQDEVDRCRRALDEARTSSCGAQSSPT